MQLLATADQMRRCDRVAIEKLSIPGIVLMENAGRAFVDALEHQVGTLASKRAVVVCGKGNNGGDGFVIARHLANRGCSVEAFLLGSVGKVAGDARTNLDALRRVARLRGSRARVHLNAAPPGSRNARAPDIVVDAVFGTGFAGRVPPAIRGVIDWINAQKCFVASVDIASGVDASTGIVENAAVRAHLTVTMGLGKVGQYTGRGCDHSGVVRVVDISIPPQVFTPQRPQVYRVLAHDVASVLPRRGRTAHKYSVGKVFVLAGSRDFIGAPVMCAQSALRSGAGAVVLGTPNSVRGIVSRRLTEVIIRGLEETAAGTVSGAARDDILERVAWADVVVVGPGLGRNPETDAVVLDVIRAADKPLLVDADGLNALADRTQLLRRRRHPTILTPHSGELGRLMHDASGHIERDRVLAAREAASALRSIVVLKGAPTATAERRGDVYLNSTGNPGMATIGSGDVLSGIIAGLCAQGMAPLEAAWAGVYLHGRAGDLAAERLGERSLLAMDMLEHLAPALGSLASG